MKRRFKPAGKQARRIVWALFCSLSTLAASGQTSFISERPMKGGFPIVADGQAAAIWVSPADYSGVQRVARHLQRDIERVSGSEAALNVSDKPTGKCLIIVGTLGNSPLIDRLIDDRQLDASTLQGKWEKFLIFRADDAFKGTEKTLVVAGSDKRGTIYGLYELSRQIGVHPWHFWADIPPEQHEELYVAPGAHSLGEPKVKYRGIFINDEAPALSGWAHQTYGGFNAQFYEKVFELILRMKGNYLWPAMWGRMFYVEDPECPKLANEMGIVIGTSHHEPLGRAHAEWAEFGDGPWDYARNAKKLEAFWKTGVERLKGTEAIVTVGMRGDGDEPMTEGTAIELLESIVDKQREIIEKATERPAEETPQMWALYKEVQDYYDKGMRVPDDVTLLLCDDNWGNIRKLPALNAPERAGGYGIYYHFDYVGDPRNYKWLNTNQIERTWEQMHLAYRHGVKQVWIVNVGDIKPMELPTQFFLDYAWNPEAIGAGDLPGYYRQWAQEVFHGHEAEPIGRIVQCYTRYNSRRKHELLSPETFSLVDYNEAERVLSDWRQLADSAQTVSKRLPEKFRDAYFQLVLFPVLASANLNELYVAAARNRLYAGQGRASANRQARRVMELFGYDAELARQYHQEVAGGKWDRMMSQTHIGYTYWQQPEQNNIPWTKTLDVPKEAGFGLALEGSRSAWPNDSLQAALPAFDSFARQSRWIEVFNRGAEPFDFKIETNAEWLKLSAHEGTVHLEKRIELTIDWEKAPKGRSSATVSVEALNKTVDVRVNVSNLSRKSVSGFVESEGVVSIPAERYAKASVSSPFQWAAVPGLGRQGNALTVLPIGQLPEKPEQAPSLEYEFRVQTPGEAELTLVLSPTLAYNENAGLKLAIQLDDGPVRIVNVHEKYTTKPQWRKVVSDNVRRIKEPINLSAGQHRLHIFPLDNGIVLQRLLIDMGGLKPSYLCPPDSPFVSQDDASE